MSGHKTVSKPSEIIAAIRIFHQFVRDNEKWRSEAAKLIRQTRYWVFYEATKQFGPTKWCGYVGMTPPYYLANRQKKDKTSLHGGKAESEIEAVLQKEFKECNTLHAALHKWADSVFGAGALSLLKEDKWRFIVIDRPN